MYTPSHFDETRTTVLHGFMEQYPLAALIAVAANGIEANHVPLVIDPGTGGLGTLKGHIARANSMWQETHSGAEVLAIFQGPSHYISPTWYPSKIEDGRVVPTWNYVVVHARGRITWIHDESWLGSFLESLTDRHERRNATRWHLSDAPAEYMQRMLAAIVGFEIVITNITGKWKLSQNRSARDRAGVVTSLAALTDESSQLMAKLVDHAEPTNNG